MTPATPKASKERCASTPHTTPKTKTRKAHIEFLKTVGRDPKRSAEDSAERRLAKRVSKLPADYKQRLAEVPSNTEEVFRAVLTFIDVHGAVPQCARPEQRSAEKNLRHRYQRTLEKTSGKSSSLPIWATVVTNQRPLPAPPRSTVTFAFTYIGGPMKGQL